IIQRPFSRGSTLLDLLASLLCALLYLGRGLSGFFANLLVVWLVFRSAAGYEGNYKKGLYADRAHPAVGRHYKS
ncbi:MAG TPA: hypothetical protein VNX22_03195, partial [Acidobacteriaceae bacterium]|nr:hypothetical protein [Acidobacteriaceae bacterium]